MFDVLDTGTKIAVAVTLAALAALVTAAGVETAYVRALQETPR